jgi:hypothetical protein
VFLVRLGFAPAEEKCVIPHVNKGCPFSSTGPIILMWMKFGTVQAKITRATGSSSKTGLPPKIPVQDTLSTCDGRRDFAARLAARLTSPDVRLGGDWFAKVVDIKAAVTAGTIFDKPPEFDSYRRKSMISLTSSSKRAPTTG